MEAFRDREARDLSIVRVTGRPCAIALAIALALGLTGCGGGGGGNVRPSSPSSPSTPPTTTGYTGGEIDVDADAVRTVTDTVTGAVGVSKGGAGSLTLTAANSYTGTTAVNAGSLYINGNQAAATGATNVAGGALLGGNGTIGGNVTIGNGGTLAPGAANAIGTLTIIGDLTLNSGSSLAYRFGAVTADGQTSDLINVKGNLTLAGTLNITVPTGGDLGPGVHRLINYDGSLVDNGAALGTLPSTTWALQTGVAHQVNLIDTQGMHFSFWDGAGPKGNNAIDGGSGNWEAGAPDASWTDASGAVNAHFDNASFAVFQGTPGTVTVHNGDNPVVAAGMQFASDGYVVQGDAILLTGSSVDDPTSSIIRVGDGTQAGAHYTATINSELAGYMTLVKTDAGTLVLGGNNTYAEGTRINGGTLQVGNGGTSGSIMGDVVNNGTLVFNRSDNTSFPGLISGTGKLVKAGTGKLTLIGENTFSGGTMINGGTLELDLGGKLGPGDITVGNPNDVGHAEPGATLQVDSGTSLVNHIIVQGNGVVDNAGTLGGNVDTGVDGNLSFAGTPAVLNHDGGHISGNLSGVLLNASLGAVVANSSGGVIEGGSYGINLVSGGRVTNDGAGSIIRSIANTAITSGTASGSVTNTNGATITGGASAIALGYGGGVVNDGAGSIIRSDQGVAIDVHGTTGNVTNTGGATISSASTAIYLSDGGFVTNGPGSTIQANGTMAGNCTKAGGCAIYAAAATSSSSNITGGVTLKNAGTIFGNVQMVSTARNNVTLSAGGVIHGDLDVGTQGLLTLEGQAGFVQSYSQAVTGRTTFAGSLTGPTTGTWVIDNDDLQVNAISLGGGTLQIGAGGTSGSLGAGADVSLYHGRLVFDRSDDITFNGTISSQHSEAFDGTLVQAGTGKLTLPLFSDASMTTLNDISPAQIVIERGTLQIDNTGGQAGAPTGNALFSTDIVNNGSLIFDSSLRIDSGSISGTGSVTQNGSSWLVLTGDNTYTGGTTINSGSLLSFKSLPGDVTINAAGTLDGYTGATIHPGVSAIGGNLTNAGKIVVHNGDTAVGGDYAQSATGTLAIGLGSKLAVTGAATLAGGTLEVIGANSDYVGNTHTEVLTAAQGLSGTFDQLVKDAGVVFTSSTINYDGHSAWLDTTGLDVTTAAAGNGVSYTPTTMASARRVQGAFNQLNSTMAAGNTTNVSSGFMQAAGQFQQAPTLQAAQASLQSLSGELHAASAAMTFEAIDASSRVLSDHFDNVLGSSSRLGMWTGNLSVGGGMGRTGYDGVGFQLNGWLVGSDRQIGTSGVAGFAFGQSQGQQQLDQSFDHNRTRSTEGMLYAGWLNGNWYTQGRIGFGHFQQDVSRQLLLGANAQGVSTNYGGDYNVAYGESGLRLDWAGTRIMPFVNLQYARIDRDGFSEAGAGGFGLRTDAQVLDRWQAGVGLRAAHHWNLDGGQAIDLTAGAQFRRTVASHGDEFEASFVGLQQWQPLIGIGMSRYSGALNLGLNATLSKRTALNVAYDYQKGQRDQAQTVSARWIMAF